jgi:hypothetical protein
VCPSATPLAPYGSNSITLTANGGTGTGYTFAALAGSLPTGMSISGNLLTGGAKQAGAFTFTLGGVDSSNSAANVSCTMNIAGPTVDCPSPYSYPGYFYDQTLVGVGGSGTGYTFIIIGGAGLPAGLAIVNGRISGTVSGSANTYYFGIQVRDSAASISVNPSCFITVAGPIIVNCPSSVAEVGYPYGSYTVTQTNAWVTLHLPLSRRAHFQCFQ